MKNFYDDYMFKMLRLKMGIKDGEYAKFDGLKINDYGYKLTPIQIEAIKTGGNTDISLDQLDYTNEDPILRVGKVNVVLYVRDQYYPNINPYKYHIAWCDTLESRKKDKKIDRYVITRKNDELFYINKFNKHTHELMDKDVKEKMYVCRACLRKLDYEGYKRAGYDKDKKDVIFNRFSLEKFLEEDKRQKSFIPEDVNLESNFVQPLNKYSSNWSAVSRRYREKVNWKCERCGKDFHLNKSDLTVHHINSSKYDVRDENLIALCRECHEKEHINDR